MSIIVTSPDEITVDVASSTAINVTVDAYNTQVEVPSGGLADQVLTKSSADDYDIEWATPSSGSSSRSIMIANETSQTASGTFTGGIDVTRALNTVLYNTITGASLASNQITLPAGTYIIIADAPANDVGPHWAFLWNITDSTKDLYGTVGFCYNMNTSRVHIQGKITIAAQKVFEIRHQCTWTALDNGLGYNGPYLHYNVYTQIFIEKV